MRALRPLLALGCALALAGALACGPGEEPNPVLGDWELAHDEHRRGEVLAIEATDLVLLTLRDGVIAAGETEIPVEFIVEEGRVRAVRQDGRGEHVIVILPGDRIQVELPIGVTAVYRRSGAS